MEQTRHGVIITPELIKTPPVKLNVGCGKHIEPVEDGWLNIDRTQLPGVNCIFDFENCAIGGRLPLSDNSVEFIYASHVLEHITHILPLMSELWRVAKPDCILMIRTPHAGHDTAYEDPTHVRFFFPKSFLYFGQTMYNAADYNYPADWDTEDCTVVICDEFDGADMNELKLLLSQARNVANEIWANLRAIKPPRAPGEGHRPGMPIKLVLEKTMHKHLQQPRKEEEDPNVARILR